MRRDPAPSPPSRADGWRERLKSAGDAAASAAGQAPEAAAYGLVALAPLGAAFGPQAMMLALMGSVVANAIASAAGAGRLVVGPRASLTLLTATLVSALVGLNGGADADPWAVVTLVALGLAASGLLQVAFGLLRLGRIVQFTPHPVRVGLTSGVGLLLLIVAVPVLAGSGFGAGWREALAQPQPGALLVGGTALAVTLLAPRLPLQVPPALLGLVAGALMQAGLAATLPGLALGGQVGVPAFGGHVLTGAGDAFGAALWNRATLGLLAAYALTVALLCSLDTLLAVSVVDGQLRARRDPDRELAAQGLANVGVALTGGLATSPSIARSVPLVAAHPGRRHLVLVHAAVLGALLLLAPGLLGLLPLSAVGGVLLWQGFVLISPALWQTPVKLLQQWWAGEGKGQQRLLAANWAIAAAVAASAVVLGLGPAVFIGASFAVLLFVRANMRDVVGRVWTGRTRRSLKMRSPAVVDALVAAGDRIVLLELEGSLFFGTADALRARLEGLYPGVETVILDLHHVTEIDVTAARILAEITEDFARSGRELVFAEWPAGDPRRAVVDAVASEAQRALLRCADDTDRALENAEERLLDRLQVRGDGAQATLDLAQTALGRGLEPAELQRLAAEVSEVRFARGELLFRIGDPGDSLFVSVKGDIGLRIPGSQRRLASFAPGVTIGEMAVLTGGTRSAEAYAETDVVALCISAAAFDRLLAEHPGLAAKLLRNMLLHLSHRLRVVTGDLSQWMSRAAGSRPATAVGGGLPGRADA